MVGALSAPTRRTRASSRTTSHKKMSARMADTKSRPLSPHLTVWRWGPHMLVSILHRVTGAALSIAGLAVLTWWLTAIAGTPADYDFFRGFIAVLTGRTFGQAETGPQWVVNVLAV